MNALKIFICFFAFAFILFPFFAFAATNISSTAHEHWARSNVIGWINFFSTNNVSVGSLRIRGFANSDIGSIALDCATSPNGNICAQSNFYVRNDGVGGLSGFAWNDIIGWISFNCADLGICVQSNYRVAIGANGVFSGWAWNDAVGWISFNCNQPEIGNTCATVNYYVKTIWRAGPVAGHLVSSVIDTKIRKGVGFNSIMWRGDMPSGTNVRFQFASSNSLPLPTPIGPGGTSLKTDTYNPVGPGRPIKINRLFHNNHRYFRYKVILESDSLQRFSPRVDQVIVNWSP